MARTALAAFIVALLIPAAVQAGDTGPVAGADGSELIAAAQAVDLTRVRALLDQGADPDTRDQQGATALHHAAAHGQADLVRILLDHGAAVDAPGPNGNTALIYAAQQGYAETARILVLDGAKPHTPNEFGGTADKLAMGWGHRDVVDVLRETASSQPLVPAGIVAVAGILLVGLVAGVTGPALGARTLHAFHHAWVAGETAKGSIAATPCDSEPSQSVPVRLAGSSRVLAPRRDRGRPFCRRRAVPWRRPVPLG